MTTGYETERGFQAAVMELAQLYGWTVWHTPDSRRTNAGEPDLRLIRPPRLVFAELKTNTGRLRVAQTRAGEMLRDCPGVEYHLWRPADWTEIVEALE